MKDEPTVQTDGTFLDAGGCTWDSAWEWFWVGVMDGCGCGMSESLAEDAIWLLREFSKPHTERSDEIETKYYELFAHWFYSKELTEHGTSVGGSWLSDYGERVLRFLSEHPKVDLGSRN